ncbi:MAG: hypothetical protein REI94_19210 [Moraxellaceae bacterium]|nr:hypothetical protein [Moraxellaceae bacterium]
MARPRHLVMNSASNRNSKKCVVIVDPERRSQNRISNLIRRLGHLAVAIQDAQALNAGGKRSFEFDLLLMVCPSCDHASAMCAIEEVRLLVGRDVPMGLIGAERDLARAFIVLHAGPGDDAIASPLSDLNAIQHLVDRVLPPRRTASVDHRKKDDALRAISADSWTGMAGMHSR